MFRIYPKCDCYCNGLDKYVEVINQYHGLELQFFSLDDKIEYIDFKDDVRKAKTQVPSINEITIHPPLCDYDIELLFNKDENIVYDEIRDAITLSNELDIDVNLLFHTSINSFCFIEALDKKMRKALELVENTRVTILLENLYMVTEKNMSVTNIAVHYDNEHLRVCFDICHAYCRVHMFKKDNFEYLDSYLNKELCEKYVKQVHFSYTRDNDGYTSYMSHGRQHDTMESLKYDLGILERYGMLNANIVTEVNEDDGNYIDRKNQLNDIKMLYEYKGENFPRIENKVGGKMYKRILMKLSGEALSGKQGFGFDDDNARVIVRQIKELINTNVELGLVIGGGNIWRGRENTDMDMSKSHQIGIMATVINAMYMQEILRGAGIKARVITPFEISGMSDEFEKAKVNDYLEKGEVCIFAGGIGQPFFTTDTGAVLNALKINADALFLAKNVDGVYDKDPKKYDDAVKYDRITFNEMVDKKLGVMDLTAAILCMENNMNVVVFDLNTEGNIMKNVKGEITGTIVVNE